ncbi:hypothetical protein ACFLV1_02200 [Chloroflexota bacterium]
MIILLIVVFFLAMFVIPRFLMKRAIRQVVKTFRQHNATDAKNARNLFELGLNPRGFIDGLFRGRDYKPYALNLLRKHEIVLMTEDGRLYLSEEKLVASGL